MTDQTLLLGRLAEAVEAVKARDDEQSRLLQTMLLELRGLRREVEDIKPHIEEFKRMKQRGIGILLGLGALATAGGATAGGVLDGLFRKLGM